MDNFRCLLYACGAPRQLPSLILVNPALQRVDKNRVHSSMTAAKGLLIKKPSCQEAPVIPVDPSFQFVLVITE